MERLGSGWDVSQLWVGTARAEPSGVAEQAKPQRPAGRPGLPSQLTITNLHLFPTPITWQVRMEAGSTRSP